MPGDPYSDPVTGVLYNKLGLSPAGTVTEPAWRTKPSWYMVTTKDRMIPPAAQRTMSQRTGAIVADVAASHSVYVSQPAPVADLMKQAAQ